MLVFLDLLIAGIAFFLGVYAGVKLGDSCPNCSCELCKKAPRVKKDDDDEDLNELIRKNWTDMGRQ